MGARVACASRISRTMRDSTLEAPNVVAQATCDRPGAAVVDGIDVIRAEFEYAVTQEGALSVDDVLDRRTRIGLVAADRAMAVDAAEEFLAALR